MYEFQAARHVAYLIDRLERLSRSGTAVHGLNPAQWAALRYLGRANRFSRNPAALADYLGSTRGTVSQTLIALEDKGLVTRTPSARDKRSLELALTPAAAAVLADDPIEAFVGDLAKGAGTDVAYLAEMLEGALRETVRRNGGRPFGACYTCRHFRDAASDGATQPHRCDLLDEPLSAADSRRICVEQEAA